MGFNPFLGQDVLLSLVSKGLNLWVRSKCNSIGELKIELNGSTMRLLKGEIDGVILNASKVTFQDIYFDTIELVSSPLKFKLDLANSTELLTLREKFKISGTVSIAGDNLNKLLISSHWKWLGDEMADNLMGTMPLYKSNIKGDQLELYAHDVRVDKEHAKGVFYVYANRGDLRIQKKDNQTEYKVPLDSSIYIESASLTEGMLYLKAIAEVKP